MNEKEKKNKRKEICNATIEECERKEKKTNKKSMPPKNFLCQKLIEVN